MIGNTPAAAFHNVPWIHEQILDYRTHDQTQKCCSFYPMKRNEPYPLVNKQFAIENRYVVAGKIHDFDWAIFNSYFDITRGYIPFITPITMVYGTYNYSYWGFC